MKRKLVASLLAASMLLVTGLTAFAADTDVTAPGDTGVYEADVKGDAGITLPTIKVTVPTQADLMLNPYQKEYGDNKSTDKIISVDSTITNASDVKVAVNVASFVATKGEGSGVLFAAAPFTEGKEPTTKSVFAYLDIVGEGETHKEFSKEEKGQLVLSDKAAKKDDMFMLEKTGKAVFAVKGDMISKPATAWKETDTFTTSLKFTFTPQIAEPETSEEP